MMMIMHHIRSYIMQSIREVLAKYFRGAGGLPACGGFAINRDVTLYTTRIFATKQEKSVRLHASASSSSEQIHLYDYFQQE
jgi:hypothetical protein